MKYIYFILLLITVTGCKNWNGDKTIDKLRRIDSLAISEEYDTALVLIKELKPEEIKSDKEKAYYGIVKTHVYLGKDLYQNNDSLLDYCIKYYEKEKYSSELARAYYYKSLIAFDKGNKEQNLYYMKKAEEIEEKIKIPWLRYHIYINMSYVNMEANAYDLSMKYARKVLSHALSNNDISWVCLAYNHIGSIFFYKGDKDSSSYYLTKILPHLKKIKSKTERVAYISNIGYIFYEYKEYEKAEPLFREAFNLLDTTTTRINLAKVCYARGKTEECDTLLAKALEGANFDEKAEIYQFMAEKAEEENCPEEANIFHKKEKIMQDSALARKKTEEMLSLQNEYDNMKKDERTGHRIGMIIVISVSALLFFAISSAVLFRRRANRTRRQITEIRKETDKYQRELENAERTSRGDKKEIERLRKKLEQGEARLSAILGRGKDLYDSVKLDGNVSRWSKDDFEAVVEYLRAKMPDEVRMIEETHTKLTAYATFFLLLSATGMDAADTARIMGISQGAVRTMRHRLKKKEKGGNNN